MASVILILLLHDKNIYDEIRETDLGNTCYYSGRELIIPCTSQSAEEQDVQSNFYFVSCFVSV
jgi:ACT domain-containing protein